MARGGWIWRIAGLSGLAAVVFAAPSDGAIVLAKLLALCAYFFAFVARSPCRSGAAYPFAHGFRDGASCSAASAAEEGTASVPGATAPAPSTRLPSTRTASEAMSRSARG